MERSRSAPLAVIGRYRVVERLGPVGLGTAYRVRSGARVLVLRLLDQLPTDADGRLLARFYEVMASVRELRHPHIAPLLDVGEAEGVPYLVLDDYAERSVAALMGYPRSWREVLPIAQGVAEALDYAHARGVVHGGLDPTAVLLRSDGSVAVAEFGVARLVWLAPPRQRGALLAERFSLAPEQRAGDPATTRSDVWAYGALLYALLTGHSPVPTSSGAPPARPSAVVGSLSPAVDAALLAALAERPEDRPAAAGAVLRALVAASGEGRPPRSLLLHYRRPAAAAAEPERRRTEHVEASSSCSAPRVAQAPPAVSRRRRGQAAITANGSPPRSPSFAPAILANAARHLLATLRHWISARPAEAILSGIAVALLVIGVSRFAAPPATAVSGSALSTLTTASPAGSWTMAGHNPARTSFAAEAAMVLEGRVVWQQSLGAGITSPPVSAGGIVIVGLADGRVVARDVTTGQARWEFRGTGPIEAGPAIADGVVFVGLKDGRVVALESGGGSVRWDYRTGGPLSGAPAAVDGVLFVASHDGRVYALDAVGGSLRWSYDAGSAIGAPLAIGNGLVVAGTADGRVHLLDLVTGRLRWIYRAGGAIDAPPLLAGGFAYVANDRGIVHALDPFAKGGPFEWERRELQAQLYLWGLPVGLPGPQPGYKWSANVASPVRAAMAAAGTVLLVPGTDGKLTALNALDGQRRWQVQVGDPAAPPIIAGDLVYTAAEEKRLLVLSVATGEKVLEIALPGQIRVSPTIARGLLFLGTEEGRLYAIK
ncbi:MAG: serine/threonine-protein kinase [Chloroflexota bacterium]|nr:PQQ-binding-like beta-propeller repeat protein [Dehalococcoidia bacterium]MDW8254973.1 serine/threonine-protein kinase [Chloroflexota bacterium]